MNRFTSAAVAALLALPLATPTVHAQTDPSGSDASTGTAAPSGDMPQSSDSSAGSPSQDDAATTGTSQGADAAGNPSAAEGDTAAGQGSAGSAGADPNLITDMSTVVVSVGDSDITAGQVRDMLSAMQSQVQGQPMEMLVPLAVEELVMRELVVQKARAEGLEDSPEVKEMANGGDSANAVENAMIRAYIGGRMKDAATDEKVQAAYDEIKANAEEEIPPLDAVRPQIEQQLRQRRLLEIRDELKSEIEVVYYGPDGEPREVGTSGMMPDGGASGSPHGAATGATSGADSPMSGSGASASGNSGSGGSGTEASGSDAPGSADTTSGSDEAPSGGSGSDETTSGGSDTSNN